MNRFLAVFALVLVASMFGCKKDSAAAYDCTGTTPTYTADVKAIFDASCATSGCHDSVTKEQGYDLSSYAGAKSAVTNSSDALLGSIQHKSGYKAMPQGGSKLADDKIKKIFCWVENGAVQ